MIVGQRALFDPATGKDPYPQTIKGIAPYLLTPTAGYPAIVALEHAGPFFGFRIVGLPGLNSVTTLPLAPEKEKEFVHKDVNAQAEHLVASAYCDRIAILDSAEKKIVLFPLGLKGGSAGSGFAEAGKRFERKLNIPAGAIIAIQSGPTGLKFEPTSGSLVWDVPSDIKRGQMIQVIMLVKGADSKESYLVEKISIP